MKIGSRVSLGILSITSVVLILFMTVQRPMMLRSFETLQADAAKQNLERSYQTIVTEVDSLGDQTQDWGSWDDTYEYVQGKNANYEKANLTGNYFETSHIDLIWIIDSSKKVIYGSWKDKSGAVRSQIKGFDPVAMAFPNSREQATSTKGFWGIRSVDGSPMIAFARPIVNSGESKPSKGMLLMGRFLSSPKVKELSTAIGVRFQLLPAAAIEQTYSKFAAGSDKKLTSFSSKPSIESDTVGLKLISGSDGSANYGIMAVTPPSILRDVSMPASS